MRVVSKIILALLFTASLAGAEEKCNQISLARFSIAGYVPGRQLSENDAQDLLKMPTLKQGTLPGIRVYQDEETGTILTVDNRNGALYSVRGSNLASDYDLYSDMKVGDPIEKMNKYLWCPDGKMWVAQPNRFVLTTDTQRLVVLHDWKKITGFELYEVDKH